MKGGDLMMFTRKVFVIFFILFLAVAFCTEYRAWSSPFTKSDIFALVSKVDSKKLLDTLTYLTSFESRYSYEVQEEVMDFIAGKLREAGAVIRLHEYEFDGKTWHNLVATVPANASLDPAEPHLVIGAHIDTVSLCPGADDNGSGSSAIMEAARVLAGSELPMRVDFVFFTLEERGRPGSSHYASDARASGEVIKAMIAVDMIAFESPGGDLELITKPSMAWIVQDYHVAAETYTELETVPVISENCR
ncbi:MAG: M28 family peptidase [Desulfobacterales bacterium]|nr:M28 family peptidase [Desulfobacterales bacterium]